jgi:hypothetical protein
MLKSTRLRRALTFGDRLFANEGQMENPKQPSHSKNSRSTATEKGATTPKTTPQ